MGRGFFSGVFWGLLATGLIGAVISLVYSTANTAAKSPALNTLEVPAGSEFNRTKPEEDAVVPQTDPTEVPAVAPVSPEMAEAGRIPTVPDAASADVPTVAIPDSGDGNVIVTPVVEAMGKISIARIDIPVFVPPLSILRAAQQVGFVPYADKKSRVPGSAGNETTEARLPGTESTVLPKSGASRVPERISRLPTIGGDAEPAEAEGQPGDTQEASVPDAGLGALEAYATAFENPDAKSIISVILIDNPDTPITDEALEKLPFPLSFAIDATRDDASAVAARYRSAGFEVLMLTNLPSGAKASDVEVAFEAYSKALPEAVAVLDRGATPKVATQLAGIMADRGFGLITLSKGLNATQKAAMREGVPAALIYRELDAKGEKAAQIGRYLDRAAFRAAQEGSVIMLGQARPETIEALVQWALQDRTARLAIAPVSAVLIGQ